MGVSRSPFIAARRATNPERHLNARAEAWFTARECFRRGSIDAPVLAEHKLRAGRSDGLVFGRTAEVPFAATTVSRRADRAWKRAGLDTIDLHECRHTFASLLVAAGGTVKDVQVAMGHGSAAMTLDVYAKLFKGSGDELRNRVDDYLAKHAGGPALRVVGA